MESQKARETGWSVALLCFAGLFVGVQGCALVELGDSPPDAAPNDGFGEGQAGDGQSSQDAAPAADGSKPDTGSSADSSTSDTGVMTTDGGLVVDTGIDTGIMASCVDGTKNGNETDVDCGGSCPKCASGKTCAVPADCVSATCASGNRCAWIVTVGFNGNQVFNPATTTLKAGDTVKFVWASGGHNVVGGTNCNAAGGWCSPSDTNCNNANTSNNGFTYMHTFASPGSYPFFCAPHCGSMKGTITAQ